MRGQKLICKLKATFIIFYLDFCFKPLFVKLQSTKALPHCPIFDHRKNGLRMKTLDIIKKLHKLVLF